MIVNRNRSETRRHNNNNNNNSHLEIQSFEVEDKEPLLNDYENRRDGIDHDIAWSNINFKIGNKTILDNCYGRVDAGQVCAIMGPSGAGKSSLLNVLSGRSSSNKNSKVNGAVTVAGKKIDPVDFRQRIAYVMQEDAHMKTVTPREAIEFSARLRLPDAISDVEVKSLVSKTLIDLGLEKCADTMCGGGLIKGISGGEKKRTSVGVEIITNPDLLFLDEPTSGLDSFTAYSIIELLNKIANKGCAVLCTIHQPSSELFALFNSIILLKEGRVLYQGSISTMTDYLSKFDYNCPNHYNPADYIMWITQRDTLDQFEKSGLFEENRKHADLIHQQVSVCPEYQDGHFPLVVRASFFKQLKELTIREMQKIKRDRGALIAKFGITIFLNTLYGLIFMSAGGKGDGDPDNLNAHFGVIMMVAISNMFGSAQPIMLNLPIERPMFLREYSTGTYGALSYFTSKTAVELPMNLLTTTIQFLIIYNMCSFSGNFTYIVLASFALASASCSVAIVLGSLVDDVKSASELQPLLFTPQLLFAGFFIRTEFIPTFLRWSQYLCSLKYAISLILLTEFNSTNRNCQGALASKACQDMLTRNGIEQSQWWVYAFVLFLLFLVFRIIAAIVLVKRANNLH